MCSIATAVVPNRTCTLDRSIQVGSHYHFFETNPALKFERKKARSLWSARISPAPGLLCPRHHSAGAGCATGFGPGISIATNCGYRPRLKMNPATIR
jgi:hypothetical protein